MFCDSMVYVKTEHQFKDSSFFSETYKVWFRCSHKAFVMLCIEVSKLLKFCISVGIGSLLEHKGFVLVLLGIGQDSVMVFWIFFG